MNEADVLKKNLMILSQPVTEGNVKVYVNFDYERGCYVVTYKQKEGGNYLKIMMYGLSDYSNLESYFDKYIKGHLIDFFK